MSILFTKYFLFKTNVLILFAASSATIYQTGETAMEPGLIDSPLNLCDLKLFSFVAKTENIY